MRFFNAVSITGAILSTALMGGHLLAEEIWLEREAFFNWEEVSDALSHPEVRNSVALEPWYINTYPIIRRGDLVTFEAASPDGQYVQFFGNCETTHITPQFIGEFLSPTRIRYYPSQLDWRLATDWRSGLLNFACNATQQPY
ncbi:hypothetical protein [Egbenema bharatensis]|uniref:hypothetical protein n=1 Tax=Egbenema bharatensis TaxID=3463334 RepID=UPI003A89E22C